MVYEGYFQPLRRYLKFSVDKCSAKTLSLFIITKWIESIFSDNQKVAFLRILQIAAPWLAKKMLSVHFLENELVDQAYQDKFFI